MPRPGPRRQNVAVRMSAEQIAALDRMGERSEMVRQAVDLFTSATWRDYVLAAASVLPPHVLSDWDGGPHGRTGFWIKDGEVTFVVPLPEEGR